VELDTCTDFAVGVELPPTWYGNTTVVGVTCSCAGALVWTDIGTETVKFVDGIVNRTTPAAVVEPAGGVTMMLAVVGAFPEFGRTEICRPVKLSGRLENWSAVPFVDPIAIGIENVVFGSTDWSGMLDGLITSCGLAETCRLTLTVILVVPLVNVIRPLYEPAGSPAAETVIARSGLPVAEVVPVYWVRPLTNSQPPPVRVCTVAVKLTGCGTLNKRIVWVVWAGCGAA